MELEADPFAEPFYLHLGAVRVGMSPVTVVPGRAVPLMRLETNVNGIEQTDQQAAAPRAASSRA